MNTLFTYLALLLQQRVQRKINHVQHNYRWSFTAQMPIKVIVLLSVVFGIILGTTFGLLIIQHTTPVATSVNTLSYDEMSSPMEMVKVDGDKVSATNEQRQPSSEQQQQSTPHTTPEPIDNAVATTENNTAVVQPQVTIPENIETTSHTSDGAYPDVQSILGEILDNTNVKTISKDVADKPAPLVVVQPTLEERQSANPTIDVVHLLSTINELTIQPDKNTLEQQTDTLLTVSENTELQIIRSDTDYAFLNALTDTLLYGENITQQQTVQTANENINSTRRALTAGIVEGRPQQATPPTSTLNISLERTDRTWAGPALPLGVVRELLSQPHYTWDVEKALLVVWCESGRNPRIVYKAGKDFSIGLFQINILNGMHGGNIPGREEWLKNPVNNVEYAHKLYSERGWRPWVICSRYADDELAKHNTAALYTPFNETTAPSFHLREEPFSYRMLFRTFI